MSGARSIESPPSSPPPAHNVFISPLPVRRKRTRPSTDISSDPPLFSSDPPEPSVENYATPGRRKRAHKGPWWQHGPNEESSRRRARSSFKRNLDSGIWMGSDSSSGSNDSATPDLLGRDTFLTPQLPPSSQTAILRSSQNSSLEEALSPQEKEAKRIIQDCVDRGDENVDLSRIHLSKLSGTLLKPLELIISQRKIDNFSSSQEAYQSFTPSLRLYLSGNYLSKTPTALFSFTNLTVLSLRNNGLTELPASIGNLGHLKELNIAGNRLRYLPWSLLTLLNHPRSLERFTILPNPLLQGLRFSGRLERNRKWSFATDEEGLSSALQRICEKLLQEQPEDARQQLLWLQKLHAHLLHRTQTYVYSHRNGDTVEAYPVFIAASKLGTYLPDGAPADGSNLPPSKLAEDVSYVPGWTPRQLDWLSHGTPSWGKQAREETPSLFELALRACQRVSNLENLPDLLAADATDPVVAALREAHIASVEPRGRNCAFCFGPYVLPRAEWIEYWHYVPDTSVVSADELFLPFLRRACSEACAQGLVTRQAREGIRETTGRETYSGLG